MPPLVYLIRRSVKEAMEQEAALVVLDMHTDGGRLDVTEEIIKILNQFDGQTATYVNDRAFSAGAFISVATREIYMAPGSVIGAAAPVMMAPGGGAQELPESFQIKMTSAVRALVRRTAEKNGHNTDVLEAMIDQNRELIIDGEILSPKGDILTLTDTEAAREYGDPPRKLLSSGTVDSLEEVIALLGFQEAERVYMEPTGAEVVGTWLNRLSPLLLMVGMLGIYLEFKTPGFGLPGVVGITAFLLYFFGSYIAGLSGLEWVLIFFLGLFLLILEIFVLQGTVVVGLAGGGLMLVALVMAMVDHYPGGPVLPSLPQLQVPLLDLLIAFAGAALGIWLLSIWFPRSSLYSRMVSLSTSGENVILQSEQEHATQIGAVGLAVSPLHPGGKAQFGDRIINVISEGEMIPKGARVRIVGYSGVSQVIVQPAP
jgi:membrane-bound serine protease (ClpP class)